MTPDLERIRANVQKLYDAGAPTEDVDYYLKTVEGVTNNVFDAKPDGDKPFLPAPLPTAPTEPIVADAATGPTDPDVIPEMTGGLVDRSVATSTGSALGMGTAMALSPLTPKPPAVLAAAATLGVTGGSYAYDFLEKKAREYKGRDVPPRLRGWGPTTVAAQEAAWETFFAGLPMTGKYVKSSMGKMFGLLNGERKMMADRAAHMGIGLGPIHVSPRKLMKGAAKVMGVFPFIGTPLREGQKRIVGQMDTYTANVLNSLAPTDDMYQFAIKLTNKAARRFAAFNRIKGSLYKKFWDSVDELQDPNIIKTDTILEATNDIAATRLKKAIPLTEEIPTGPIQVDGVPTEEFLALPIKDMMEQFIAKARLIPARITPHQAQGLQQDLNVVLNRANMERMDVGELMQIKKGLDGAKHNFDYGGNPPAQAQAVMDLWKKADDFFRTHKSMYENVTGKRFERIDKNIFSSLATKWGSKNSDEAMAVIFNARSVEALDDLEKIVGKQHFKRAGAKYIQQMLKKSTILAKEGDIGEDLMSAAKFEKNMGLDSPEGWRVLERIIKGTGTTTDHWRSFLEVAKQATDITVPDPSTFMMRKLILAGGTGAMIGSILPAAGSVSFATAVLIAMTARAGSKYLMNPKRLKELTRLMLPETPGHAKKIALLNLITAGARETSREKSGFYDKQENQ